MGLTINFKWSLPACVRSEAGAKIEALRREATAVGAPEISDVRWFTGKEVDAARASEDWRWFLIGTRRGVTVARRAGTRTVADCRPVELVGFRIQPGEGCEECRVGLARYPERITFGGRSIRVPGDARRWRWSSFVKTQYAADPEAGGVENFLRCHLAVIAILDAARRLGFAPRVDDEGGYWQKRSVSSLAAELGAQNEYVAALAGALDDAVESSGGARSKAPIKERPDYERLEALGQKQLPKELLALMERTRKVR